MIIDLKREDLYRLLQSIYPDMQFCNEQIKKGNMIFTGNQHNERWQWKESYLDDLSEQELWDLYQTHKD